MKYLACFILLVGLTQCKKSSNPIYAEVMEIHDAVMPKTGEMSRLSRTLKKQIPEEGSLDRVTYLNAIKGLEDAEEAMMVWMSEFDSGSEEDAYLLSEKVKIKQVSDDMLSSIAEAKKILGQ